jgi:hypothetical protein
VGSITINAPIINQAPVFNPFLEPVNIKFTEGSENKFYVKFPGTIDPEGTKVALSITSTLPNFITFSKSSSKLTLSPPLLEGTFIVDVKLTDADEQTTSWKQKIVITKEKVATKEANS